MITKKYFDILYNLNKLHGFFYINNLKDWQNKYIL